MSKFEYYTPLDIASAFRTSVEVGLFIEHMIDELMVVNKNKGEDFIPPVVYSAQGRAFNFDYNFMIECLSSWLNESAIEGDFMLREGYPEGMKNGEFLVVSLLEKYYEVVRINNKKVNLSKYKNSNSIEINSRFYNVVLMGNGMNVKRFSATPFSESAVKKLISLESFARLESISKKENFEQIAFGLAAYQNYVSETKNIPENVGI